MAGTAARSINMAAFDITSNTSSVSLGDASSDKICTHCVQITMTDGTLIFQGTLGTQATGTYVTLGYIAASDPGTVVTTGLVTVSGVYYVRADALSDVRVKVSVAGTVAPSILNRPILG